MNTRNIPAVKTWRLVLEDGRVYHVLAPTRMLAILNLRSTCSGWGSIKSIGVLRSSRHGIHGAMVTLVNLDGRKS